MLDHRPHLVIEKSRKTKKEQRNEIKENNENKKMEGRILFF